MNTPINNGNREQTKQGMFMIPVGAIAPGGSSCVSIFRKRIIGTATYRKLSIFHNETGDGSVGWLDLVSPVLGFFSTGMLFL